MKPANLASFLDCLKKENELHVIELPVDPCLELAEIQRRVVERQGPALLFTNVKGTEFPVATNLFGTRRRIDLAFGEDPCIFFKRVAGLIGNAVNPSLSLLWRNRDMVRSALKLGTVTRRSGPVLERVMNPARLKALPQLKSWPMDGGAFLTLPLAYSENPVSGMPNIGMYRNQIFDDTSMGMHFQIQRGMGFHYFETERLGKPLPVNIFLGGPPSLILSSIAPLPENIPEAVLASLLQGRKLDLIRNPSISELPIFAESEFAIIGRVPPGLRRMEGPFGDHYGYYSLAHPYPVFQVERIYHRKKAIFPATVVGRPRQEDHYIGEYLQDLFAPLYPLVMNGVHSVWAYDDAGVHTLAGAVVKERYPKEAFMAGLRILGEGQLSLTKFLMVTDSPVPLRQFRSLLTHILERADFATDLFVFAPASQDTLDYTSGRINEGSKAILMGLGEKRFDLRTEPFTELSNPLFRNQKVFAPGVLVVEGPAWKNPDSAALQLLGERAVQPFRLVCMVDNTADCVRNEHSFLWTVFTRFEPAADIYSAKTELERFHVKLGAPILLDCRMKPWFPAPVEPLPETVTQVDALWPSLFPNL